MLSLVLIFAVISALLSVGLTMVSSGTRMPVVAGIFAFLGTAGLSTLWIFWLNPSFTHWATGGYFLLALTAGIIAIFVALLSSGVNGTTGMASALVIILFIVVRGLIIPLVSDPGLCRTGGVRALANMLQVQDAPQGDMAPDLDINKAIRVSPENALKKARRAMPTENNIGSYLQLGNGYLQNVQGRPQYVFSLSVTNARGFRSLGGGVIPGYILVDAADPNQSGRWVELPEENQIRYAEGLEFWYEEGIGRHVYFDFELPQRVNIDELEGMEVDDNLKPWYTATVMEERVGYTGYYPVGIITVNPTDGEITRYTLEEAPTWIDRRMPEAAANQYAAWWAEWNEASPCQFAGTSAKKRVDDVSTVWGPEGLVFQYVITSPSSDQVATDLIYVNPQTMSATRYTGLDDVTQSAVEGAMEQRASSDLKFQVDARNCQIEWIAGRRVWYCLIEKDGLSWGVGVVQPQYMKNADQRGVIIAQSLESAYTQLRTQIAIEASGGEGIIDNSSFFTQVEGTIDRVGNPFVIEGKWYLPFTLQTESGIVAFRIDSGNNSGQFIRTDDTVTVTAVSVNTDSVNDVVTVENHTYPLSLPVVAPDKEGETAAA